MTDALTNGHGVGPRIDAGPHVGLTGVKFAYGLTPVLHGIDLEVSRGECVALMGASGSGKSTILLLAAGILVPNAGSVVVGGRDLGKLPPESRATFRRTQVGLVFQFGELIAELSLRDNVALAAELAGQRRRMALSAADGLLARVGLEGFGDRLPGQVSGGQAQRAAVARALVHNPDIVIADEPTGALDSSTAASVLSLLLELATERGALVLVATHDPVVAARCHRVVTIRDGLVTS